MGSKLLSELEEVLSHCGYSYSKNVSLQENFDTFKRCAGLQSQLFYSFRFRYRGHMDKLFETFEAFRFRYRGHMDEVYEAFEEAYERERMDLFLEVSLVGYATPYIAQLPSKFAKRVALDLVKRRAFGDLTALIKEAILPHEWLSNLTSNEYKLLAEGVEAAYSTMSAEDIEKVDLFLSYSSINIPPRDEDAQRVYHYRLLKQQAETIEALSARWKVKPVFKVDDVEEVYLNFFNGENGRFYQFDTLSRLIKITGIYPDKSIIKKHYDKLFKRENFYDMKEVKRITGIDPAMDFDDMRKFTSKLIDGAVKSNQNLSKLEEYLEVFGPKYVDKDGLQKIYAHLFESRLSNNLTVLGHIVKTTGITPTFDSSIIQKEYSFYLSQGWITELKSLKEATGVPPEFNSDVVKNAFLRELHREDNDSIKKLIEVTGLKPRVSDVQIEYTRYFNNNDFDKIIALSKASGIEPEFEEAALYETIFRRLEGGRTFSRDWVELLARKIKKQDLEKMLLKKGVYSPMLEKLDEEIFSHFLNAIFDGRLNTERLNRLKAVTESEPAVLYSKNSSMTTGSCLTYGQMLSILDIGLVTRNKENLNTAYSLFGKEFIDRARQLINGGKVFKEIFLQDIELIKNGDVTTCERVLNSIKDELYHGGNSTTSDLMRIWDDLKNNPTEYQLISKIQVRTWRRGIEDIFDNEKTQACIFYPYGLRAGEEGDVIDYMQNQDIELIDMYFNDEKLKTATAICYKTKDPSGKKVLLIDSVEAGKQVVTIGRTKWIDTMMNAIRNYSKENDFDYIFVNDSVTKGKATDFKNRVKSSNVQDIELYFNSGVYTYLEANPNYKPGTYNKVSGYMLRVGPQSQKTSTPAD